MKIKSKTNRAIVHLYAKGYRVGEDGLMRNPKGNVVGTKLADGYHGYCYKYDGIYRLIYIHRMAMFQKVGVSLFQEGLVVRHLDDDKSNNRITNLALGTRKENARDMKRNGIKAGREKAKMIDKQAIIESLIVNGFCNTLRKFDISGAGLRLLIKKNKHLLYEKPLFKSQIPIPFPE